MTVLFPLLFLPSSETPPSVMKRTGETKIVPSWTYIVLQQQLLRLYATLSDALVTQPAQFHPLPRIQRCFSAPCITHGADSPATEASFLVNLFDGVMNERICGLPLALPLLECGTFEDGSRWLLHSRWTRNCLLMKHCLLMKTE